MGFGLAAIAVGFTNVGFFRLLGLDVLFSDPRMLLFDAGIGGIFDSFTLGTLVDWVGTAMIIGWGGTELTHSVITGLVRGRKLWEETEQVRRGEKSILDIQFFQESVAPELEKLGVSVTSLRQAFTALDNAGVSVDQLVVDWTQGKAEDFLRGQGDTGKAMLALMEEVPEEKKPDLVQVGKIIDKLTPELRLKFLGA